MPTFRFVFFSTGLFAVQATNLLCPADPRRLLVASPSAPGEAASGSSDGGHPVRHVMRLLRRHYGKVAALSSPRPYHRGQETALGSWAGTPEHVRARRLATSRETAVDATRPCYRA